MTTEGFLSYLRKELLDRRPGLEAKLQMEDWLNRPGIPSNSPVAKSAAFTKVEAQMARFLSGANASELATKGWSTQEWVHFIRNIPESVTLKQLTALDTAFHFTAAGNSEIASEWFEKAIRSDYQPAYPALEKFLTSMGRRKFLKPLYTALAKTPGGRELAVRIYSKARPGYHSVSRQTIDKILKWDARS